MKQETKKAKKEQWDQIFDILKQRSELQKMGVSVAYIDKYFCLSPNGAAKNSGTSSDDSSSRSIFDWSTYYFACLNYNYLLVVIYLCIFFVLCITVVYYILFLWQFL